MKKDSVSAFLSFLYFYFTITAYYILKPARNSLYIEYLGADNKPYVTMFIAVIAFFAIIPYINFSKKHSNNKVVSIFLLTAIGAMFLFRWGFLADYGKSFSALVSFLFFAWLTLFSSVTVMQFWNLLNDIFDSQKSKRLYGFIGAGGILGGITGSKIARFASSIGTENLFLFAAAYIFLMLVLFNLIWYLGKHGDVERLQEYDSENKKFVFGEIADIVKKSKYIFFLLAIVGLVKFVTAQTEWQFDKFVDISNFSKDYMTSFYGRINEYLSYIALFVQVIFTSKILKKLGVKYALLPLPAGLFAGTLILLFTPALWAMAIIKISEGSLRYSLNQSAQNYLYLPVTRAVRYRLKPFIDVVVYQFAKGLAGLFQLFYIFLVKDLLKLPELSQAYLIGYFNLGLLLVWFYSIHRITEEYPNEVVNFLRNNKGVDTIKEEVEAYYIENGVFCRSVSDINVIKNALMGIAEGYGVEFGNSIFSVDFDNLNAENIKSFLLKARVTPYERFFLLKKAGESGIEFTDEELDAIILIEAENSYYLNRLLGCFMKRYCGDKSLCFPDNTFFAVLHQSFYISVNNLFILLKLRYNQETIQLIEETFFTVNNYIRANVVELLGHMLKKSHAKKYLLKSLDQSYFIIAYMRYKKSVCEHIPYLNCNRLAEKVKTENSRFIKVLANVVFSQNDLK